MNRAVSLVLLGLVLINQAGAQRVAAQTPSASEDAKRFVGTWRIVSDTQTGIMIYDSLGNMAAQVMPKRVRPKYAGAQPTPDEAKAALTGYLAYFGTYTVDVSARTISHHRLGNINPGQIGDDAVRKYEFESADRLILTPAESGNKIIWERAR